MSSKRSLTSLAYNANHNQSTGTQYNQFQQQPNQGQATSSPDPYGQQTYNPYIQQQPQQPAYPVSDDDSEVYDSSGIIHNNLRQEPLPHHVVDNPDPYGAFPEEPNSYLLNQFDRPTQYNPPTPYNPPQVMPQPMPQEPIQNSHGGFGLTNFYHGFNDSQAIPVEEVDNFQPFPVSGDDYYLNEASGGHDSVTEPASLSFSGMTTPQYDTQYQPPNMGGLNDQSFDGTTPLLEATPMIGAGPGPFGTPGLSQLPPEQEQQRRAAIHTKNVRLFKGNLVLDCPVAHHLLDEFDTESIKQREFTHMRYSAATCDPNHFAENNFTLRQMCFKQTRETEILICVTIYNEDDVLLGRTLEGVFKNIKHLVMRSNTRSKVWGDDAWKKVVVCVIADGRKQMNERALGLMARLGVYQDGLAKNTVADKEVQAHIYEYTTMVGIKTVDKIVEFTAKRTIPIQMIFCMKERNQKKINSHRWLFNAVGKILNPKICVLLDAGTQPAHDSVYHLWKTFDDNTRIGGACGEIRAGLGKAGHKLVNPLVAAQNFEYKMSNILDKPMESVFGFISVLPGAFSAYRYAALQNNEAGEGPLEKYFKGETLHDRGAGLFTANMYLAEDRILCFELVAKRQSAWLLKYVKSAHAVTDVPESLAELILQRRRWLNGSFFAAIYSMSHFANLWHSSHSFTRKAILHLEFMYQFVSILFSWFSIGNFFLVFRILTNSLGDSALGFGPGKVLGEVFLWLYIACIVSCFILSFGNRPKGSQRFYVGVVVFFAILMLYLLFAAVYISVKSITYTLCENDYKLTASLIFGNSLFRDLVVSLLSTYALYFVSSFLFLQPWHMFTCFFQYLLLSPSYINVLNVYAFCNIHDISWGTKGDDGSRTDLGKAEISQEKPDELLLAVPTHLTDIENMYRKYQDMLAAPPAKDAEKPAVNQTERDKDYYAMVRSSVVLVWVFTNFIIIAVVLNTAGVNAVSSDTSTTTTTSERLMTMLNRRTIENAQGFIQEVSELMTRASSSCGTVGDSGTVRTEIYLTVVLWCVAALATFRFVGAVLYIVSRLFGY